MKRLRSSISSAAFVLSLVAYYRLRKMGLGLGSIPILLRLTATTVLDTAVKVLRNARDSV